MVAGRLTGSLNGRPVVIDADDAGLLIAFRSVRTAWELRQFSRSLRPLLRLVRDLHVPVRLRVAGLAEVNLLPRSGSLVRFFAPGLADLG